MGTTISDLYWNSLLSGSVYNDSMSGNATLSSIVESQFAQNTPYSDATGLDCAVYVNKKIQGSSTASLPSITIAFRGTESFEDAASDLISIKTGVVENQIVSMYNYLLRVFALPGDTVEQYSYLPDIFGRYQLVEAGTATGLGLVPAGAKVNFSGHSLTLQQVGMGQQRRSFRNSEKL